MAQVRWIRRWLAALLGLLAGLLALELFLRVWSPVPLDFEAPPAPGRRADEPHVATTGFARLAGNEAYQADDFLGFRPVLGGRDHDTHGALRNDYTLAKRPGVRRLLFLGDSVARRGQLQAGLELELGAACEYWNAGIEGYSTLQELEYYRRYLAGIQADHVVLVFHLNDFVTTPVTLRDGERIISVRERRKVRRPVTWLWELSYLYRLALQLDFAFQTPESRVTEQESRAEVFGALLELAELVRARGADFSVVVFPWLLPEARWQPSLPAKHADTLALLEQHGIRHHSFREELAQAIAEGEEFQEKPRDPQHPSAAFGHRMARAMLARGFVP
jgi:hypothetical protein